MGWMQDVKKHEEGRLTKIPGAWVNEKVELTFTGMWEDRSVHLKTFRGDEEQATWFRLFGMHTQERNLQCLGIESH